MDIDAKTVLYGVIERIGKKHIESEIISSSNVPQIIRDLFSASIDYLHAYEYDEEKVHSDLAVALMHYLLSVCLIQSERKVEHDKGLMLDIVIPSARQLRTDPKRTLLLAFPKKTDPASINAQIDALRRIQPNKENIWIVFGHYNDELITPCKEFSTYVPDNFVKGSLRPFSSIIDDIRLFLEVNKIKSFKIFPV